MKNFTIIFINSYLFLVGWITIMLLGADFPPPSGFYKIVLLIAGLDLIQFGYLWFMLPKIRRKDKYAFLFHLAFYLLGGILTSILMIVVVNPQVMAVTLNDGLMWGGIITLVSLIYSVSLWFLMKVEMKLFLLKKGVNHIRMKYHH